MSKIHKVLIVAFLDESRSAAYEISTELKKFGFGIDFAFVPPAEDEDEQEHEPESQIYADVYLTKHMDLVMYDGIVFLDDGGDADACRIVAKRANEGELALGGYGFGCQILHDAKILKDKYISVGLPKDFAKGNKVVNSPAVRAENIVTSAGNCPVGFAFLMVDALGGKVTREVESVKDGAAPIANASLVLTQMTKWAEHWTLAEKLAADNQVLLIADWQDLDIPSKTVQRFLAIGPAVKNKVAFIEQPCFIPQKVWLQQPSIKTADASQAAAILKSIGCSLDKDNDESTVNHHRCICRELDRHGVWPTFDGKLAVRKNDKVESKSYEEAIRELKGDVNYYVDRFNELHSDSDKKARLFARLVRRAVLKLRLIYELKHCKAKLEKESASEGMVKTADYIFDQSDGMDYEYGKGSVPGPYSNVNMPGRVIPWNEGDDWLEDINGMDEQTIANLNRYHPDSKDGFYAEFDLWHQNDPIPWDDVEKGEGYYPTRRELWH